MLFGVLAVLLWLLFAHPDINETARHAYILLRSIGDGGLLQFYENVYTFKFGYTYTNAAHYGIVVYLLYAVWELPLFLLEKLTGLAFPDMALALWCKAVGVAAVLGCAALLRRGPCAGGYGLGDCALRASRAAGCCRPCLATARPSVCSERRPFFLKRKTRKLAKSGAAGLAMCARLR